jgi:hypothetical protein
MDRPVPASLFFSPLLFLLRKWPPLAWARQQVTPQRVGGHQSSSVSGASAELKTNEAFSLQGHWHCIGTSHRFWWCDRARGFLSEKLWVWPALGMHYVFAYHMSKRDNRIVTTLWESFLGFSPNIPRWVQLKLWSSRLISSMDDYGSYLIEGRTSHITDWIRNDIVGFFLNTSV